MSVISCPRCDIALRKIRLGLLCRQCEGCWLNFDQLDLALTASEDTLKKAGLKGTLKSDHPEINLAGALNCPICEEKLRRFPYMVDSGIMVDVCSKHGMWLDDGELGAIRSYCEYAGVTHEVRKKEGFFAKLFRKFK